MPIPAESTNVRRAQESELPELAEGLARAFQNDPVSEWLLPDPQRRELVQTDVYYEYLWWAMTDGSVYTTDEREGAAIWLPSNAPLPEGLEERIRETYGPDARQLTIGTQTMAQYRPHEPHQKLTAIGAFARGRGIGTALLQRHMAELEQNGEVGYLNASSEGSKRLYIRLGWSSLHLGVVNGIRVDANDETSPTMYPMTFNRQPSLGIRGRRAYHG
ncbi:MAG TPA: GNAT family N-acetyltransferase [Candidatus Saccharimonadales bacterium]|nr:GNAT family N-acetyltransferase [Candidatus Saccharimonadales bacterium]